MSAVFGPIGWARGVVCRGVPVGERLEAEASAIVNWQPLLVPGLLQTPDYAKAVMRGGGVPEDDAQARVAAGSAGRPSSAAPSRPDCTPCSTRRYGAGWSAIDG